MNAPEKTLILADPRGFCAGVDRAIAAVRTLLAAAPSPAPTEGAQPLPPVYVRRQIVHNQHVVEELSAQGAVFVEELSDIPDAAAQARVPVVFSAHGVAPSVVAEAQARGLYIVDATCPLVSKVHREVQRFVKQGYDIIYIGHHGHDEAIGVVGEAPEHVHVVADERDVEALTLSPQTRVAMLTQTTLSVDETHDVAAAIQRRFPAIVLPPSSDICYATQNRQLAVKQVANKADAMVIVGSANSSNSVRLMEVAQAVLGAGKAHRVEDASEVDAAWLVGARVVGVSSGASVPERLVQDVVEALREQGFQRVTTWQAVKESMHFVLPSTLRARQ